MLVFIAACLLVALAACAGDGESPPSIQILLEADMSGLSPGADPDRAMDSIGQILERRAGGFGVTDFAVELQGDDRLSVTLRGPSLEDARRLIGATALLEFRHPVLDGDGQIVCQAADGTQFSVSMENISYVGSEVRRLPQCLGGPEGTGEILWERATAQGQALTGAFVRPNGASVDRTRTPLVVVEFTDEGSRLLEEITSQMVGFPLGIFLDDEFIAGPTVGQSVSTGDMAIGGLSLSAANLLAIHLNAGPLPVPIRTISVEEAS